VLDRPGGYVVPDVLIHAKDGHTVEPGLIGRQRLEEWLDRGPDGAPGRAELPGEPLHARVLATQLSDRPPTRPSRQQGTRLRDFLMLLGERPGRTRPFSTAPGPLTPDQLHRPTHAGHVDQPDLPPATTVRNHPAGRAALLPR